MKCLQCKKEFLPNTKKKIQKFCSMKCWMDSKIGKTRVNYHGYKLLHFPSHPMANSRGDVLEHRLVMMNKLGRNLEKYELIHHKNGVKNDNRIENLEIILQFPKIGFHSGEIKCPYCSKKFSIK